MTPEAYLTSAEVAAKFPGMGARYVERQARSGAWPHLKFGRRVYFTPEQVDAIVELHSAQPSPAAAVAASHGQRTRRTSRAS